MKSFAYKLFKFDDTNSDTGLPDTTIVSIPPSTTETIEITDFNHSSAEFINTSISSNGAVCLSTDEKILSILLDQSGSMTWNDSKNDKLTLLKSIIEKIKKIYPDKIKINLVTVNGEQIEIETVLSSFDSFSSISDNNIFETVQKSVFQNSVYNLGGIRVVRRTDRYPATPLDGLIITDSIIDLVFDTDLVNGETYYYTIYTYNEHGHFSNGINLKVTAVDPAFIKGVASFDAEVKTLFGPTRDESLFCSLIFSEHESTILYDSSGNKHHFSLTNEENNTFWAGSPLNEDPSTSVGGLLLNGGYLKSIESNSEFQLLSGTEKTINFWAKRYLNSNTCILFSVENNTNFQYRVKLVSNKVAIQTSGGTFVSNAVVGIDWTMVTLVFQETSPVSCDVFLNGLYDSTVTFSVPATLSNTYCYVGGSALENLFYYGSVGSISFHNTARSTIYIENLYDNESHNFVSPILNTAIEPADNGERSVLINWLIPDEYEFDKIKITRQINRTPNYVDDGDIVVDTTVTNGSFSFLDCHDFINGANYYYRIFTLLNDEVCHVSNALVSSTLIPFQIQKDLLVTELEMPVTTLVPGDRRVLIKWNSPTDSRVVGTRIYYNTKEYPNIDGQTSTSVLIFDSVDGSTKYVHRNIPNDINYYSVIFYDKFGNISAQDQVKTLTSSDFADVIFDSDEISDLHIEQTASSEIKLQWKNPILETNSLDLWFGESAIFLINIKSLNGNEITTLPQLKSNLTTSFEISTSNTSTNASFGNLATFEITDLGNGLIKGIIRHTNNTATLNSLASIKADVANNFEILDRNSDLAIFKCSLNSVLVNFSQPLSIDIENLLQLKVPAQNLTTGTETTTGSRVCPERFCESVTDTTPNTFISGGYANQSQSYIARVYVSSKNLPVPDGTIVNISLKLTGKNTTPVYTKILEGSYQTVSSNIERLDSNGVSTGIFERRSYVDVEMQSPITEETVDIIAAFSLNGLQVTKNHTVTWLNTLKMEVHANKPMPDGIDSVEQFANIYFVDPDDPENIEKRTPVVDGTIVQWKLEQGSFAKDRPFYSTEPLAQRVGGVYSLTKNGTARNVFFGPISNIKSNVVTFSCASGDGGTCCVGEEYKVVAQIVYNDKTYKAGQWIGYDCQEAQSLNLSSKILMTGDSDTLSVFPHYLTYADGESLIHLKVISDPTTSSEFYADCFIACLNNLGMPIYTLPCNQLLQIDPGELDTQAISEGRTTEAGIEVLWDVVFDENPYTGEKTIVSYESLSPFDFVDNISQYIALVPVSGATTDIYLRWNKFVGDNNPAECKENKTNISVATILSELDGGSGPCDFVPKCHELDACGIKKKKKYKNVQPVNVTTTLVANNKTVTLTGGGTYEEGIPPVYVGFKEPLAINIVDIRVNGINGNKVQDIIVDGVTRHTFVVEATFAGKPVPSGTPINLEVVPVSGDTSSIVLSSSKVYTHLVHDPIFDPLEEVDARSLAYFEINPLPNVTFSASIKATCNYDKLGTVSRKMSASVKLSNTANTPSDCETPPCGSTSSSTGSSTKRKVVSNEVIIYSTINDEYSSESGLLDFRSGQFSWLVSNLTSDTGQVPDTSGSVPNETSVYLFGGWDGNKILASSEIFDIATLESTYTFSMITPRVHGMTQKIGDNIYCIGGIEVDSFGNLQVSRKIESFNIVTQRWNPTLATMPAGVSFGVSMVHNGFIYVLSGVRTIVNNCCSPESLNTDIYKYDPTTDTWSTISTDEPTYSRISPFSVSQNGTLLVYSGSTPKTDALIASELNASVSKQLNEFKTSLLSSSYYKNLPDGDLELLIGDTQQKILENTFTSPYFYLSSAYIFDPETETVVEYEVPWKNLPALRSRGCSIESGNNFFTIGGSNVKSSTSNRNEKINLSTNEYTKLKNLPRGRCNFSAHLYNNTIYFFGGFTSGHQEGWLSIDAKVYPTFAETIGKESPSISVNLYDDGGELVTEEVELLVRGRINIPFLTPALGVDAAKQSANAIVANSNNNASQIQAIIDTIKDPSSDQFQLNAVAKLDQTLSSFPVLFSESKIKTSGTHTTYLLPRSEDPFMNLKSVAEDVLSLGISKINDLSLTTSGSTLSSQISTLANALSAYKNKPIEITANQSRKLYDIEIEVTVLSDQLFGQTICSSTLTSLNAFIQTLEQAIKKINATQSLLSTSSNQGTSVSDVGTVTVDATNSDSSGQNVYSKCLLGITPEPKQQNTCPVVTYFNTVPWIPQTRTILGTNSSTADEVLTELQSLEYDSPFGSSQIFDGITQIANLITSEEVKDLNKYVYIFSDTEENLSSSSLDDAVNNINAVDGLNKTPIIFNVINTALPASIVSEATSSQSITAETLSQKTNGQTTVLNDSKYINEIADLSIRATGGLGHGVYRRVIDLGELSSISKITPGFFLPTDATISIRFRTSTDGQNYSTWTKLYKNVSSITVENILCRFIEIEVVLNTEFIDLSSS